MPRLEDYDPYAMYFGSSTDRPAKFGGDFDAPLKNRTSITVGGDVADYTYDATMAPVHYADAVNNALADPRSGESFLHAETVSFTQKTGKVVTPLSNNAIRGAGIDKTVINTSRADYVFKSTTNNVANVSLSDMTIDCGNRASVSAIEMRKFDGLHISRVKFKNSVVWFAKSANSPADTTSDINNNFVVEDSIFDTHNGILEMLLVFNTNNVDINRTIFTNKTGSAGAAPTLGFWQKVTNAVVRNSKFENLIGDAIYYGFTANNLLIRDCLFDNVRKALHGAIVSDYGKFGTKYVSNIAMQSVRIVGGANSTSSEAIQIGAVHDFVVADSYIEGHAKGIKIGFGNNVPSAADGGDASFPSVRGKIYNVTMKDINPLGTNKTLNSPIFFGNGGDFKSLLIHNVTVQDDNNYIDYAVIFNGATTGTINSGTQISGGAIAGITLGNTFAWYDTAPTVTISGDGTGATATATLDTDGRVTGFTITNGGTGYTSATVSVQGAKYKNITFNQCDFGGKKILVNDLAQLDTTTIRFINCRNFDTSNLSQAFIDACVVNQASTVMHDGLFALGSSSIPAFTTFYVAGASSTFQHNNIRHTNSNDNLQHIMANFTGKKEVWYKNNTNSGSKKMELDVDTGVLSSNGVDANLGTDVTTGGLIVKRLTSTERDALASPPNGTMIYNTTLDKFQGRQAGAWVDLA